MADRYARVEEIPDATYASGAGWIVDRTPDQSLYQHQAEQLDKALAALGELIAHLENRLHLVLDPQAIPADNTEQAAQLVSAPLISHLGTVTDRVNTFRLGLETIIHQLVI